ncbi:TonB-dependent receptor [Novosphingobium sp. FSY-8]|uniref:TonB-dependent receptor n=2 Tax=Novosphingobium ovatum TaxID=1908523 RepID=A0ABW9XAX8_9SPHN|nr:TonB-dependent receptor [Novosphingobium ovatum]
MLSLAMAPSLALAEAPAEAADPAAAPATDGASAEHAAKKREIVVIATRLKAQVDAPQPPIAVLDEEDIAAYGVSSITDLLDAISPQTGSGRGRGATMPVILVNGQRIASFREMRDFPPEAIRKVEILPEEVALRYGYSADQRVVNFILKDHFRARNAELEFLQPDVGGYSTVKGQAGVLRIDKGQRVNLTAKVDHTSPLTEAERGVSQSASSVPGVASDPDPAANRTLVARSENYVLNGTYTKPFGQGVSGGNFTLNATASRADSTSLSGLNTVTLTAPDGSSVLRSLPGALARVTQTDTFQLGLGLNKPVGDWQLSATMDASRAESRQRSSNRADTSALTAAAAAGTLNILGALPDVGDAGYTLSTSKTTTVSGMATLMGRPLSLPAGKAGMTFKTGYDYSQLDSASTLAAANTLRRGNVSASANLALPITSTKEHVAEALGNISANVSAGANYLSDFGWLGNWNAGLTWNLTSKLGLQASYMYAEAAPSLSNLGGPLTYAYNVSVYDFATGRSALVTTLSGGNPALQRESRHDIKLGLNWTLPILSGNSNLIVEYFNNRSNNVTTSFPTILTPQLEAAFPGRVGRDSAGNITAIDRRAITLAQQNEERIRWGINIGGNLGKAMPMPRRFGAEGFPGGPPPGGPPPGGFGGGGRGGFGGGPGGPGGPPPGGGFGPPGGGPGGPGGAPRVRYPGRWNLSAYHTVQLVDRVTVASGGPVLNLLNGDALSGAGIARHTVEVEGGFFYSGAGIRLNGGWTAPTRVTASGVPGSSDLRFGALFKVSARVFVDLGQQKTLVEQAPFFKGARFSIMANNLFDQRQRVTDGTGATPTAYQPYYMDASGRVIGVEFRKMF